MRDKKTYLNKIFGMVAARWAVIFILAAIVLPIILTGVTRAASPLYLEYWPIPEVAPNATKAVPIGNGFIAPNGDYWFVTGRSVSGVGYEQRIWVVDKNTNEISGSVTLVYAGPGNGFSQSEPYFSGFISDSTGKVWFTGADYRVVPINLSNGKPVSVGTEVRLPPAPTNMANNWGPEYITVGPDDTFWYADKGTNGNATVNIRNTRQDGTLLHMYTVPVVSNGSGIQGLRFGSDGNLWFGTRLSSLNSVVGKLDVATGQLTTYSTQAKGFDVQVRALGADGNIWFTVGSNIVFGAAETLGKITPAGDISYYDGVLASYLVAGHENNIVFRGSASMTSAEIQSFDTQTQELKSYDDFNVFADPSNLNFQASFAKGVGNTYWYVFRYPTTLAGYTSGATYGVGKATIDGKGPTVTITSPSNNTYTNASAVSVSAAVSDTSGVVSAQILANGLSLTTVSNPAGPITYNWDVGALSEGAYALTAKAQDGAGNQSTSQPATVTIDRTNPFVQISSPANNSNVNGKTTIAAIASDQYGVANVRFTVNGTTVSTDSTAPYSFSWDTKNNANGSYMVAAIATDKAGNTSTSSSRVDVRNNEDDEVTICHYPGTQSEITLEVNESAVNSHLAHGDYTGSCAPRTQQITTKTSEDGITTKTVAQDTVLPDLDIEVKSQEVLVVNGTVGDVTAKPGAVLKGNGQVKEITVESGAVLAPGESPGCIKAEKLDLSGTYSFEARGTTACKDYDQTTVSGPVTISGTLDISLLNEYAPEPGSEFMIINNTSNEKISGTFANANSSVVTKDGISYKVAYDGGDGNDVVITVVSADSGAEQPKTSKTRTITWAAALVAIAGLGYILSKAYKSNKNGKDQ